jgi:hypothetical protein
MEGGVIPAGKYLIGANAYVAASATTNVRIAVYVGGEIDDPTGATLLRDFGSLPTTETAGYKFFSCEPIAIPAGNIWLVARSTRTIAAEDERSNPAQNGNWQADNGYYAWTGAETNPTVEFPAIVPAGAFVANKLLRMQLVVTPSSGAGVNQPTTSVSYSSVTIIKGQSATLTWAATNADSVTIDNGIGAVATSGSIAVSPKQTTVYTITAVSDIGTATSQITVLVRPTGSILPGQGIRKIGVGHIGEG